MSAGTLGFCSPVARVPALGGWTIFNLRSAVQLNLFTQVFILRMGESRDNFSLLLFLTFGRASPGRLVWHLLCFLLDAKPKKCLLTLSFWFKVSIFLVVILAFILLKGCFINISLGYKILLCALMRLLIC